MLKFAAVGTHGRELFLRVFIRGLMLVLATPLPALAQAPVPSAFEDLVPELVAKITSTLAPGALVSLTVTSSDSLEDVTPIRTRAMALLAARGIRVVDGTAATAAVAIGCGRNLRERVCVAEIRSNGRDQIATVTRPLTSTAPGSRAVSLALELRPLRSQQTQILDVVLTGDRLLVLDVAAVTLFEQKDGAWRELRSRPLPVSRAWPRDPRGRIRVDGSGFELFLPGMSCTGRTDAVEISCREGQQPWPIGVENSGLEPGRNYFKSREGAVFYNAAPLGAAANDDAVELTGGCAAGTYVVAVSSSRQPEGRDLLNLSRVTDGRLVPAASPIVLPGVLTALWSQADHTSAVVVAHDVSGGRYDAFQTSISCSR